MKHILATLVFALTFGAAFALELPQNARFMLVSGDTVVGIGELEGGNLDLDLLAGFSGDVFLTVTDADGNIATFEVTITAAEGGALIEVLDWDTLAKVDLMGLITEAGGRFDVSYEEEADFAEMLEEEAEEAAEEAADEAEEAADEAEDEAEEAAEEAADEAEDAADEAADEDDGSDSDEDDGDDSDDSDEDGSDSDEDDSDDSDED